MQPSGNKTRSSLLKVRMWNDGEDEPSSSSTEAVEMPRGGTMYLSSCEYDGGDLYIVKEVPNESVDDWDEICSMSSIEAPRRGDMMPSKKKCDEEMGIEVNSTEVGVSTVIELSNAMTQMTMPDEGSQACSSSSGINMVKNIDPTNWRQSCEVRELEAKKRN